jgi:zinc protease
MTAAFSERIAGESRHYRRSAAALLLAMTVLGNTMTHAQSETASVNSIIPYPTHERTLDNGLKVILMPMPSNGLASYWTIVRTGSRDEYEPGRSGFAHFFEHMMFRGTERFPSDEYQRRLTAIGADANAFTTDDFTAYHLSVSAEDLQEVMLLESDRFQNLSYSESDFATEAGAVYGEYRKSKTDPLFVLYESLMATAFERHPYGHTTLGYERDIAAMPTMYDYSRSFFNRYYRPDNIVLFVAGDIDPAPTFALIEQYYEEWKPGYVAPPVVPEPEQYAARHTDVAYEGQTLPLAWAAYKYDAFDRDDPTYVAADFLTELAFGETSDAYRRLVLNEQVVEYLVAGANLNRDPTLIDVYTRVKDPEKVDYVFGVIDETVADFKEKPPEQARVDALKLRLRYDFLMGLETPDAVASALVRYIAIDGGLDGIKARYAAFEKVTPADVQRAAQKYLSAERLTTGTLRSRQ